MKPTLIFLFVVLISCNKQIKNDTEIDASVYEMWNNYIQSYPQTENMKMPESWYFHNNKEDANRLAALTRKGKKKAGSGLYLWYKEANADLPRIGTKHIITDFNGKAQAIIEITKVDTIPFNKITKEYAERDMGTENGALEKWKKAHWEFFSSSSLESGKHPSEDMLVVCEEFETIWIDKKE